MELLQVQPNNGSNVLLFPSSGAGGPESLPPILRKEELKFGSWFQGTSWHSETSGMPPQMADFPCSRELVLQETTAVPGKEVPCSGSGPHY